MNADIQDVVNEHPHLEFDEANNRLIGKIFLDDAMSDSYWVDIRLRWNKKSFPKVFETEERIPREEDRHVNGDGSFCFFTPARIEILRSLEVRTLLQFVNLVLIPYLQHNSYYEMHGTYLAEYSHNTATSSFETFTEISGLEDSGSIIGLLERIENGARIRPNEPCYCGSGKKIKKCLDHNQRYENLKKLSKDSLQREIRLLRQYQERV
jgi:Ser/Thr protein kinase RdoA (MazF antagonist)